MIIATGNNFGAGEIRFLDYQTENMVILQGKFIVDASADLDVTDAPDAIGYGHHCFLARTIPGTRMDSRYQVQFRDFYPDFRNGRGRLSISNRAGGSGDGFELFGTCAIG